MRSSDGVRALRFVGVVTLAYVAVFVAYPVWNALAGITEVTLHVAPISFESSDPSTSPIAAILLASVWVFAVFLVLSCHRLVFALGTPALLGVWGSASCWRSAWESRSRPGAGGCSAAPGRRAS